MIRTYDSVAELRQDAIKVGVKDSQYGRDSGGFNSLNWFGNETYADTLQKSLVGDTNLVPQAEKLLSQLEQDIEVPRRVWERSPAGAYCSVPDYVNGLPTSMRRMREIGDEHAPITILVMSSCSAGISAQTMQRRGTVILALVMALSRVRPVSLWTVATTHGIDKDGETIMSARINTDPLDLATACYTLTSVGFARRLTYGIAERVNGFNGQWPRKYQYGNPKQYYEYLKKVLSQDPTKTLVVGAAELHDELLDHPLKWIKNQINHFVGKQEAGSEGAD